MEIILVLAIGTLCIVCFLVGAKVGQTASKGEPIELPSINPMKAIREHQEKKQAEKEQDRFEILMHNIDAYDGTSNGQKEV